MALQPVLIMKLDTINWFVALTNIKELSPIFCLAEMVFNRLCQHVDISQDGGLVSF